MKEVLFFWLILSAFLVFDNLVVIARGSDSLSISRHGKSYYKSRQRNTFAGRDILFLNPLNLFDRVIFVERVTLKEDPYLYKKELRSIDFLAK